MFISFKFVNTFNQLNMINQPWIAIILQSGSAIQTAMIRLNKTVEYLKQEVAKSNGVIRSIFLGNGENEIITAVGIPFEQASILSTLFNDSIFIIRLNLLNGEEPPKNERPFEINLSFGERQVFLFSIKNALLLGVIVDEKLKSAGHKMANDVLKFISEEMENVVEWTETADVY